MDNYSFLLKFVELVKYSGYFDEVTDLGFAIVALSTKTKSYYSNVAFIKNNLNDEQLLKIEEVFRTKEKDPVIELDNTLDLRGFLSDKGYQKNYGNSFLTHNAKNIDQSFFNKVKKVQTEEDLQVFLEVFDQSYQKGDPQNPYGDVKEYIQETKESWKKYYQTGELEYFVVYQGQKAVSVAILNNDQQIGYISCVGSLKEVRGQGFGKLVTLFAVSKSKQNGNKIHCLATEDGTFPDKFYQTIGFVKMLTTVGMLKKT